MSELWVVVSLALLWFAVEMRVGRRLRAREEPIDEWIVELDDEVLGLLADGAFRDMFWTTYTIVGDDPRLFDPALWCDCRFQFRHARSGRLALHAYAALRARPTVEAPRVTMRGLG